MTPEDIVEHGHDVFVQLPRDLEAALQVMGHVMSTLMVGIHPEHRIDEAERWCAHFLTLVCDDLERELDAKQSRSAA
jgi:hypothetical protein